MSASIIQAPFYYRLVSPTVNITIAASSTNNNKTFNTNIPVTLAMVIRRVTVVQATKDTLPSANITEQVLWELTEDTTKTAVAQQDPFALVDGGLERATTLNTQGVSYHTRDLMTRQYDFLPPHPGVPTVAQQLNLVCTGNRIQAAGTYNLDTFVQLYYELVALNDNIRTFLTNRIALQRTT